ncbi:MAG: hypothetical protein GY772_13625, partial [bacterium]|nr:hypothetical protein [bacterium]
MLCRGIQPGDVPPERVLVRFNALQGRTGPVPLMGVDVSSLGGNRNVQITSHTEGDAAISGTFTLSFCGFTTAPIAHDASAADVDAALEALDSIPLSSVTVTGGGVTAFAAGDGVSWDV